MSIQGDALRQDPRVAEAKKLLQDAVAEHAAAITSVRPAQSEHTGDYDAVLKAFADVRGAPLFYPYVSSGLGNGALIELMDGSVKYDFISGIGVHGWGHSHPDLVASGVDAAISDTVMQGNLQQIPEAQEVQSLLIQLANANGANLDRCFLTSSGAMANENAFKIAYQSRFPASRVLAFKKCFAGRTLAMAQVTDKAANRDGLPTTIAVDYVPFFDAKDPQGSTERAVKVLQMHINRYPKQHASMVMELIQGEGGYYSGSTDFFKALIQVLKDNNILVHIDEIQTFGRSDHAFAFQHFGLDADVDMVSVGKMSQVCATLYKPDLQPRAGLISQTFTSSTSAIFAAKSILTTMTEPGLFGTDGRAAKMSQYFRDGLAKLAEQEPDLVAGPFGFGAMVVFTPFKGEKDKAVQFSKDLYNAGVLSFIAGTNPTRIRFLIPIAAVTEADIDGALAIIRDTLRSTVKA